jgi:hypothetical protein
VDLKHAPDGFQGEAVVPQLDDLRDITFGQSSPAVPGTHRERALSKLVGRIALRSIPPQIVDPIIELVSVEMTGLHSLWANAFECLQDEGMDGSGSDPGEIDRWIAIR